MKNKKKFTFLALALAAGMVLGACNPVTPNPSSSAGQDESSSSSEAEATLVSIAVTAPTKVAYTTADTALDLAGMVVTATYSNQSTGAITEGYTVSQVDFSIAGQKTVTVTYEGKTDSFNISVAAQRFTVKFVVEGREVQTGEVEEGQLAAYTGDAPTKAADANAPRYRFKGWDRDLTQPITANTTFTAQFAAYAAEQVVDNFESYSSNGDMADAGWVVAAYPNDTTGWTEDTPAAVSVGSKAAEGNKSLRFDGWENGVGYRFVKHLADNAFPKAANAIKFSMQIPSMNTVRVILKGKVTIAGQQQEPSFTYEFHPSSSEYVEYTIPIAADGWALWNKAGDTIKEKAEWIGIHQDDFVNYLTDVGFFVQGSDGGTNLPYFAFVDNVRFVTLDEPVSNAEVEAMGQYTRYTGVLNNGYTVKVQLGASGSATATVLDAPEQQQIPGTVAIDDEKNMTFTSADNGATLVYKAALKNGGQFMKFVQASGAFAEAVTGVDLNAVQVVDNFEQYTTDGQSYCLKYDDPSQRSGCRGAYYSEWWNNNNTTTSPWGGAKWSLMGGEGDQLKLKTDGGHSGNKYVCMKNSKDNGMRYMQWGLFDGTAEQNNFRGSKFSFWAKTKDLVKKILVNFYSQSAPTNETRNQYVKQVTFTETAAIGEWKHYEIDLNPNLTYYGYMIYLDANWSADSYLYVDDVEVYTANPYATYVPPKALELPQGETYSAKIGGGLVNARLDVLANKAVKLSAPGFGVNVEGTYTTNENDVTMTLGTDTYVATASEDLKTLTFKSVSGSGMVAQFLNNVSFAETPFAENAETYSEDGKMYYQGNTNKEARSGARGAFYCEYQGGSDSQVSEVGGKNWILMGGNGDQLQLDKSVHQEGAQSLKMKYSSGGAMRYMQWELYEGTATAKTGYNRFGFWIKNASGNATTVNVSVYKASKVYKDNVGDNNKRAMTGQFTLAAGTDWTFKTIELDPSANYYGFAVWFAKHGSASDFVNFDNAYFFNTYESHELNFFAKEGLALSGEITAGQATMTIGQKGALTLSCEALGGDLPATYSMSMSEGQQMMTVVSSMGNITGTYSVSNRGVVTFTVTAVTGDLTAGVNVGAILSNAA